MRPSSIITFEPGLEHGVPWGRDLFTFVTSAAGHMMRTLQRPRKNKPSKRQVNHRRFLHNMIQRKFAEIEAANHQLASALFSTDKSQNHLTAQQSHTITDEVTDQTPKPSKKAIDTFINADKTEALEQDDVCDLWTLDTLLDTQVTDKGFLQWKPINSKNTNQRTEKTLKNRSQKENSPDSLKKKDFDSSFESQLASTDLESLTQMSSNLLEDGVSTWFVSTERMRTNSKPFITKYSDLKPYHTVNDVSDLPPPSPVISLLSLDSCDLEIQMLIDADHVTQTATQDSPITENLQMDMVDSFDLLLCSDNQEDLQIHNPKGKMAEWIVHEEEYQNCVQSNNTYQSSVDSGYYMDNLAGSHDIDNLAGCCGASSTQEFEDDSQMITVLANSASNVDQKGQELSESNVLCNQDPHGQIFHHNQVNYSRSQNNTIEDHFRQLAPCTMTNGKEVGYLATGLSVSNQMLSDCIGSSDIPNHHIFQEFQNQQDCQSKRIPFGNWEQQSGKTAYKNYSQSLETHQHLMLHERNNRNADKDIVQDENDNGTGSKVHGPIMERSCFDGLCYDEEESCSYSKFRDNQCSHNFEGIARSFPATIHRSHPTPIPTLPLEDDWLFSNIVTEVGNSGKKLLYR